MDYVFSFLDDINKYTLIINKVMIIIDYFFIIFIILSFIERVYSYLDDLNMPRIIYFWMIFTHWE